MLRGQAGTRWTAVDRTLAVAHMLAADLVCSGCGQPAHEARNPDSEGYYEVRSAVCNGCAALAVDAKAHKDKEQAARQVWTVDTRPPDVPLMPWTPD